VLMLIDGVPVMPGDSGDIKWDMIPATQIERVEIIKGAGSALYGSSALGGVINIITKEAAQKPVTNIRLAAAAYDHPRFAEWKWTDKLRHFEDFDIDHSRKIGKANIFLAAGRHEGTGYAQNGDYHRMNATAKVTASLTSQQKLTISSNYEGGDRSAALLWKSQRYALQVPDEAIGDYVKSNKFSVNTFHQWAMNKNFALKSRVSYFRNYWKNFFHDNITATTANKYGFEIQGDYQFSEQNSLTFGTENMFDHVASGLVGLHDQYMLSGYMQNERKLIAATLLLTLGCRYDFQHIDDGFEDSQWSPKIGLVWHAQSNLTLRASTGKGFRAASMSERFADGLYSGLRIVPNIGLQSESAWSQELGVNYTPGQNLYFDLAGFISNYYDLIEPQPDETQTIRFMNITRARISGIESNIKIQHFLLNGLYLDIGYTYMNPRDLDLNETLAYRSRHLFTGALSYVTGPFEFGWDYRLASRLDQVKIYTADDRVDQKVNDARIAFHHGSWTLGLNINNVFNYNYTQQERTLMPIRHYVTSFSATF
jgi:outer membrane receptor for ferrienterochelin and colicins